MKVAILAAGSGERLTREGVRTPKPLVQLGGMSLLERAARASLKAGAAEVLVVLGSQAETIRRQLETKLRLLPLRWIVNENWEKGNGTSVLAARPWIADEERFLVMMADHLLLPPTLRRLIMAGSSGPDSLMAIDRKRGLLVDPDDATKLRLQADRIVEIGKDLSVYDGIDVGAAVVTPLLFEMLAQSTSPETGACSHTGGMKGLARAGRLRALDIGAERWEDVDSLAAGKAAENILLDSLRKPTDGFMSRHLERHLSLGISKHLAKTSITPNQVTIGVILIGGLAAWFFAQAGDVTKILGAFLFWCSSFLDGCDGELARMKYLESRLGGWLDLWSDNLVHMMVFSAMGVGLWRDSGQTHWIFLGLAAAVGVLICVSLASWNTRRKKATEGPLFTSASPEKASEAASRPKAHLIRIADALSRRDFIFGVIFLAALGWLPGFLWAAAVGTQVYWMVLVVIALSRKP